MRWAWDADPQFDEKAGEQWLVLLPQKWNKQVHYGWRYDPREREAARAERPRLGGPQPWTPRIDSELLTDCLLYTSPSPRDRG